MRSTSLFQALAMSSLATSGDALSNAKAVSATRSTSRAPFTAQPEEPVFGRRRALESILGGVFTATAATAANALDMDAFASSTLDSDKKSCDPKKDPKCVPQLTSDQAMCTYGMSGEARGEACKRVKAAGGDMPTKSKEKSMGGAYAM